MPVEKEVTRINGNREEITKTISYWLKFIDSARFMSSSLSNHVNDLAADGIHKTKCKYRHDNKKCETCGIKYKYWVILNIQTSKLI